MGRTEHTHTHTSTYINRQETYTRAGHSRSSAYIHPPRHCPYNLPTNLHSPRDPGGEARRGCRDVPQQPESNQPHPAGGSSSSLRAPTTALPFLHQLTDTLPREVEDGTGSTTPEGERKEPPFSWGGILLWEHKEESHLPDASTGWWFNVDTAVDCGSVEDGTGSPTPEDVRTELEHLHCRG